MSPDVVMTWAGAAGLAAYVLHIHRRRTGSFLESRMLLLLYCLVGLFLIRGFFWIYGGTTLKVLTFVPATLLPLATTLFVESLLRRHVNPFLKWFVTLGTLASFPANLLLPGRGEGRTLFFDGFSIFVVLTLAWLALVLLWRDRASLSPAENAFVRGVSVAVALSVPLGLSDFRIRPEWLELRLGGLGGLFLVYTCVRLTLPGGESMALFRDLAWLAAKTLGLVASVAVVVRDFEAQFLVPLTAIMLAFVLLFTILDQLGRSIAGDRVNSFRRWLLEAETGSLEAFIHSLDELPLLENHEVLREKDLDGYDLERIAAWLSGQSRVWSLATLRRQVARKDHDPNAAEQLIDLLEAHDMSQVTRLSRRPFTLLLVNLPDVASGQEWQTAVALIGKTADLMDG